MRVKAGGILSGETGCNRGFDAMKKTGRMEKT